MLNEKPRRSGASQLRRALGLVFSVVIIATAFWVFNNRQYLADSLVVASFSPSESIETITERAKFTDTGKRIFYAAQPIVSKPEDFNKQCPRQEAGSPILGCYTTNDRIYIYDLTNDRLDGMEEVTAAHEMLHAVWQRLSNTERERLTGLLEEAYAASDDQALKKRMEYYQRTEPGQLSNELHSILGTESHQLNAELENYYAQYFDRPTILAHHANYSQVYTGLYDRSEELYATMQGLSDSIESRSTQYGQDVTALDAAIVGFNARANAGSFASAAAFNIERSQLVTRSQELDSRREAINADIATYETYYKEYQQIASEIQVLNDSTDSFHQLEAAPSV